VQFDNNFEISRGDAPVSRRSIIRSHGGCLGDRLRRAINRSPQMASPGYNAAAGTGQVLTHTHTHLYVPTLGSEVCGFLSTSGVFENVYSGVAKMRYV